MKKTAIAVAAALTAAAAGAADITVYGLVDTGLLYSNTDTLDKGATDSFSMESGFTAGSRFGFKGTEDLGNGYAVSFILENGFAADTGKLGQDGRLFGREASLKVHSPYGTMSFGRAGSLLSGTGSLEVFGTFADTIAGGWSGVFNVDNYQGNGARFDNMVTYQTPTAAGFTGYAQYSFANDTIADEDTDVVDNMRDTDRYAAFGLTYANGPVQAVVIYDTTMYRHFQSADRNVGDARNLTVGGSYDFGFMRVSAYGQYVKGARNAYGESIWGRDVGATELFYGDADGYNLHLGTRIPMSWGRLYVAGYYGRVELNDIADDADLTNWNVMLTGEYDLSKRTALYSGIGFRQVKGEVNNETDLDAKTTQVVFGLRHRF